MINPVDIMLLEKGDDYCIYASPTRYFAIVFVACFAGYFLGRIF